MKTIKKFLCVLLPLVGILTLFNSCEPIVFDTTGNIQGEVRMADNHNKKVAGATVILTPGYTSCTTDMEGKFSFTGLDAGEKVGKVYKISVQASGLASNDVTVSVFVGKTAEVFIDMKEAEYN